MLIFFSLILLSAYWCACSSSDGTDIADSNAIHTMQHPDMNHYNEFHQEAVLKAKQALGYYTTVTQCSYVPSVITVPLGFCYGDAPGPFYMLTSSAAPLKTSKLFPCPNNQTSCYKITKLSFTDISCKKNQKEVKSVPCPTSCDGASPTVFCSISTNSSLPSTVMGGTLLTSFSKQNCTNSTLLFSKWYPNNYCTESATQNLIESLLSSSKTNSTLDYSITCSAESGSMNKVLFPSQDGTCSGQPTVIQNNMSQALMGRGGHYNPLYGNGICKSVRLRGFKDDGMKDNQVTFADKTSQYVIEQCLSPSVPTTDIAAYGKGWYSIETSCSAIPVQSVIPLGVCLNFTEGSTVMYFGDPSPLPGFSGSFVTQYMVIYDNTKCAGSPDLVKTTMLDTSCTETMLTTGFSYVFTNTLTPPPTTFGGVYVATYDDPSCGDDDLTAYTYYPAGTCRQDSSGDFKVIITPPKYNKLFYNSTDGTCSGPQINKSSVSYDFDSYMTIGLLAIDLNGTCPTINKTATITQSNANGKYGSFLRTIWAAPTYPKSPKRYTKRRLYTSPKCENINFWDGEYNALDVCLPYAGLTYVMNTVTKNTTGYVERVMTWYADDECTEPLKQNYFVTSGSKSQFASVSVSPIAVTSPMHCTYRMNSNDDGIDDDGVYINTDAYIDNGGLDDDYYYYYYSDDADDDDDDDEEQERPADLYEITSLSESLAPLPGTFSEIIYATPSQCRKNQGTGAIFERVRGQGHLCLPYDGKSLKLHCNGFNTMAASLFNTPNCTGDSDSVDLSSLNLCLSPMVGHSTDTFNSMNPSLNSPVDFGAGYIGYRNFYCSPSLTDDAISGSILSPPTIFPTKVVDAVPRYLNVDLFDAKFIDLTNTKSFSKDDDYSVEMNRSVTCPGVPMVSYSYLLNVCYQPHLGTPLYMQFSVTQSSKILTLNGNWYSDSKCTTRQVQGNDDGTNDIELEVPTSCTFSSSGCSQPDCQKTYKVGSVTNVRMPKMGSAAIPYNLYSTQTSCQVKSGSRAISMYFYPNQCVQGRFSSAKDPSASKSISDFGEDAMRIPFHLNYKKFVSTDDDDDDGDDDGDDYYYSERDSTGLSYWSYKHTCEGRFVYNTSDCSGEPVNQTSYSCQYVDAGVLGSGFLDSETSCSTSAPSFSPVAPGVTTSYEVTIPMVQTILGITSNAFKSSNSFSIFAQSVASIMSTSTLQISPSDIALSTTSRRQLSDWDVKSRQLLRGSAPVSYTVSKSFTSDQKSVPAAMALMSSTASAYAFAIAANSSIFNNEMQRIVTYSCPNLLSGNPNVADRAREQCPMSQAQTSPVISVGSPTVTISASSPPSSPSANDGSAEKRRTNLIIGLVVGLVGGPLCLANFYFMYKNSRTPKIGA